MKNEEQVKADLLNMKNLSEYCFNWFHDGGAMVILINYDCYVLFEVPEFGGHPMLDRAYHESELDQLIEKGFSWT